MPEEVTPQKLLDAKLAYRNAVAFAKDAAKDVQDYKRHLPKLYELESRHSAAMSNLLQREAELLHLIVDERIEG